MHAREAGLAMEDLAAIVDFRSSDRFTELEKDALEFTGRMTETPVRVDDALFDRLRKALGDKAMVELAAAIATENFSARFNHAFGIESNNLMEDET
jgi:alkylhydroperoxidase family enzyme